jgi:hypothetical protein
MSLPESVDWTPNYLAVIAQRTWGDATGDCVASTMVYAMELRNILQGGVPVQLSELDLNYQSRQAQGQTGDQTGSSIGIAEQCARGGVCREDLWPYRENVFGPETWTTGVSNHDYTINGMNRPPNAAAVADRQNHKLVDGYYLSWDHATFIDQCKTALAARYPVCFYWPPGHEGCAMGYNAAGVLALDGRATQPGPPSNVPWGIVSSIQAFAVTTVAFSGTIAPAPIPAPIGNTQMLLDTIKAQANALVLGQVTQAQIDAGRASWAQLVPDGPVGISGESADGSIVPPALAITDSIGGVFMLHPTNANASGKQILLNGVPAADGYAPYILYKGGRVYATNLRWYYVWNGSGWAATVKP